MKIYIVEKASMAGLEYASPYYTKKEDAIKFFDKALKYELQRKTNKNLRSYSPAWEQFEKDSPYHWSNEWYHLILNEYTIQDGFHESDLEVVK